MHLYEDPVGALFTEGPAIVVKVEQRREQRVRSLYDTRGVEWEEFGVVIYMAKGRATPVQRGEHWVMPETAHETNFVIIQDVNGSCEVPENAGRVLGHYRQNGRRWWVFVEKLGSAGGVSPPAPGARQKSTGVSPPVKAAPGARVSPPARPSAPQASPAQQRPQGTSAQGGR